MTEITNPVLAEVQRGSVLECVHRGSVAVCRPDGSVEFALGEVIQPILPRSACKMIQALPLVESGAADAAGLTDRHIAVVGQLLGEAVDQLLVLLGRHLG